MFPTLLRWGGLVALLLQAGAGQTVEVQGTVRSDSNAPVAGAVIWSKGPRDRVMKPSATSDPQGQYKFSLPAGQYQFFIDYYRRAPVNEDGGSGNLEVLPGRFPVAFTVPEGIDRGALRLKAAAPTELHLGNQKFSVVSTIFGTVVLEITPQSIEPNGPGPARAILTVVPRLLDQTPEDDRIAHVNLQLAIPNNSMLKRKFVEAMAPEGKHGEGDSITLSFKGQTQWIWELTGVNLTRTYFDVHMMADAGKGFEAVADFHQLIEAVTTVSTGKSLWEMILPAFWSGVALAAYTAFYTRFLGWWKRRQQAQQTVPAESGSEIRPPGDGQDPPGYSMA